MIGDGGELAFILALLLICVAVAAIKQQGGNVNHGVSRIYTMIRAVQRLCQGKGLIEQEEEEEEEEEKGDWTRRVCCGFRQHLRNGHRRETFDRPK
ncbi:hypothetical protein Q5P01_023493 [Channa striata]|uniref:Uncharacterized protein n=1 Tax=Channa striata TaxID=64152 RepID=A0AA88LKA1_CHASR|nr:hypothetical protein Q5P01_023493 [Channa striata]